FMGSQVYADFKDDFHRNGFDVVIGQQPFSSVYPEGKCLRVYKDPEKTRAEFEHHSHKDAVAWHEMIAYFQNIAPLLFPVLQMPIPSMKIFKHSWKMYRKLGRSSFLDLIRVLLMSPRRFVEERFITPEMQALLTPWAYHLGLSPDCAVGATFSFLESAGDHLNGMVLAKGGTGNLIKAMVKTVEEKGGQFLLGCRVKEVKINKGKAVGVVTDDGREITAKKGVIASVTPNQIIKLIDSQELPSSFVTKCRQFKFGPGTLMIHMTLDRPLKWDAAGDLTDSTYVHIAPYVSDIAATNQQVLAGLLPSSPLLVVAQQSRQDPSRAPEGKHVLWVQVRAFPPQPTGDASGQIKGTNWHKIKEPIAQRIINKLADYAPAIRDIIRKVEIHSPLDLERANPGLVGGDMVGGSHHIEQNFIFRPFSGWSRYKTPIRRLYMIGHSTWPGGGLNATSGYLGAMQLLKDK
ncbi:MAG: NAD(P)/FAD-dependent oxidoreductase, partial [Syntrophaceae bacterium]|nr:NAD(P)/FAD-dependent oxidoreductase [Syntrophaceae bacterium]